MSPPRSINESRSLETRMPLVESSQRDSTAISNDPQSVEVLMLQEELISQFQFWMDDQIQTGMRLRHELFQLISKFESAHRQQAFDMAWKLSQKGTQIVVSVSTSHYTVWARLRSSETTQATN